MSLRRVCVRLFLGLSFVQILAGCAALQSIGTNKHSRFIREVDWPVTEIRAVAFAQMPLGEGSVSTNGRELTSKYFITSGDRFKDGEEAVDRYLARFTILGDRRPYDVEVLVIHERRVLRGNEFVYAPIGHDARLTRLLEERLRKELTKRREDRNVIDDFRVY